LLNAGYCWPIT